MVLVAVGVVLVAAGSLIGLRLARAGTLPGVTVDGQEIGGLPDERLHERLANLARRKAAAPVQAVHDDVSYQGTGGELGYAMDVDATAERILHRGRQGNPITALRDHLRAFFTTTPVTPVQSVDDEALTTWAQDAAEQLERDPREGRLRFDGADITRVDPRPGAAVDIDELADQARAVVLAGTGGEITVTTEPIEPRTTAADVDDVLERAEQAVSAPVTFSRNDGSATLSADQIGDLLRTRVAPEGSSPAIRLRARPARLTEAFGQDTITAFEVEPRSARFEVSGGSVDLIKGRDGFTYDQSIAARQLIEVATGDGSGDGSRDVELDGEIDEPELSTDEAEDLKIVEKVSEFTTNHACCESRVTNIHRIADLVRGVVIQPGETFSVNGHVGERTTDKGFAEGGAIFNGEFVSQVGGGVSQFATTLYNAAYFGGYEIVDHKAHSFYISRYPEGREATLDFPSVDLKIRNNSPHGLLLHTSYTDTSITVSTYGTTWVDVDSETGPRHNFTEPKTQYKENDDLPKGEERVIQEAGANGFDVTVTRILRFPDGETERETETTTYLAQPRIIERNT